MTAKWRGAHGIILLLFPAIDAHAGNPPGSYQATCQNILVAGADLTAECQTTSGNWQLSALPTFSQWCAGGTISNSDGNLDCPIGSTPPSGSYALTCRNLSILGSALTAQCKTINGTWQQTALQDFAVICAAGSISNINGNLTCTPSGALPGGSYQQTCRDAWVIDGNTLNAQCQTMSGAWSSAQLQGSAGCANGINNFDGRLTCNSGSLSASGSFTQTCRLIWNNDTPIWFAWNWCGTGAHVMVVNGYDGTDGAQNVWVLNPEDASPELYKYAEWSAFPNLPNCNASACTCPAADTYGHAFQGDFYGIQ